MAGIEKLKKSKWNWNCYYFLRLNQKLGTGKFLFFQSFIVKDFQVRYHDISFWRDLVLIKIGTCIFFKKRGQRRLPKYKQGFPNKIPYADEK